VTATAPIKLTVKDYKSDYHNDWCPGCVRGDTPVVTADGLKNIRNVCVGENVLAHDGRFHVVTETMSHQHPAPMRRLVVWKRGEVLLTPDHPVYAITSANWPTSLGGEGDAVRDPKPTWIAAEKLRIGDLVATPVPEAALAGVRHTPEGRERLVMTQFFGTESYTDAHQLIEVVGNDEVEYDGMVYNLEVEGAHSYVTNVGALHNCGDFGILSSLQMSFAQLKLEPDKVAVFSGIGCSGKTPHYLKTYGFHTLHGRVLTVATGGRLVNNGVTVVALGGDGDGYGIGAGYFVNTGRRNLDFAYIVHNNGVYGLTKGQSSPTMSIGKKTKSMAEKAIQDGINPIGLAVASGYTFIARGYALDPKNLSKIITAAIEHKGSALVDVLQTCPTYNDLYTKEWYEGDDLPTKRSRLYSLEESGYDGVVKDPTNLEEVVAKKAQAVAKSYEVEPIPIGIYYKIDLPTYEERLAERMPEYAKTPLVEQDTFHRDISPLIEEMR